MGSPAAFISAESELSDDQIWLMYGPLILEASNAFRTDPSYLIDMAEHGSQIAYKRALWEVRAEAMKAEQAARKRCEWEPGVLCINRGACGFGACRFATEAHKKLEIESEGSSRPCSENTSTYDLEATIQAMLTERKIVAPPKLTSRRKRVA